MEIKKPFVRPLKYKGVLIEDEFFLKNIDNGEIVKVPANINLDLKDELKLPLLSGAFCEFYMDRVFLYGEMFFKEVLFTWVYVYRVTSAFPMDTYSFPKEENKLQNLIEGILWETHGFSHSAMSLRPFAKPDL